MGLKAKFFIMKNWFFGVVSFFESMYFSISLLCLLYKFNFQTDHILNMLAARLCSNSFKGLLKPGCTLSTLRHSSGDARSGLGRFARRRATLKEQAMAPSSGTSINVGQGALAGAAALGIGALAFYGAGLSGEMGAVEKSVMWPQYVKDRIRDTYM